MRRRLVSVLTAFSLLTVAAFVVPLLAERASARAQSWLLSRSDDLDRFAVLAARQDASDELVGAVRRHAELYGEGVLVVDAARRPVAAAGIGPDAPGVDPALDAALRNERPDRPEQLTPFDTAPVLLWRPVGTGTRAGGVVLLRADPTAAAADVSRSWALVLACAVAAALTVVALALGLARWVLRPVGALARGVRAVAEGRAGEQIASAAGPAELRELAESFNRMSAAVRAGAQEQERLVADASHQIRNPLAALRLRVDGLEPHVGEGGQRAYQGAVGEVDRLERLLDGMLGLASAQATASAAAVGAVGDPRCDAAGVAAARVAAWGPAATAARVTLRGAGERDLSARIAASDLEQILDVLIDNAIRHAGRGATVEVGWVARSGRVTVTVADDGPGIPEADRGPARRRFWQGTDSGAAGGSGLGLAIADRLVAAHGGTMELGLSPGEGLLATVVLEPAP